MRFTSIKKYTGDFVYEQLRARDHDYSAGKGLGIILRCAFIFIYCATYIMNAKTIQVNDYLYGQMSVECEIRGDHIHMFSVIFKNTYEFGPYQTLKLHNKITYLILRIYFIKHAKQSFAQHVFLQG